MSRTVRIALLIGLIAATATLLVVQRDGGESEPAWATCETEAVGAERSTTIDEPLPATTFTTVAEIPFPTDLTTRPDDPALYVAVRDGRVLRLHDDGRTDEVTSVEVSADKEQGLLSIAFDPDGEHLYLTYTDLEGTSHVVAAAVSDAGEVGTPVAILELEQFGGNHNIDQVTFGPDGLLWISSGDGGSEEREGDVLRVAQDTSNLHGTIMRVDPDPVAGGYTVPADNPFVDHADAAPEIWAYGFRNPWRFSFDPGSDDLWISDVGQFCWEEINLVTVEESRGANFGWSAYEGFHRHHDDQDPDEHVLPLHVYQRLAGTDTAPAQCAVIGGHVVRGAALPALEGMYLFGDYCSGEVRVLRLAEDGAVDADILLDGLSGIQSLAQTPDGATYVLDAVGVHRLEVPGDPADSPAQP